jgi:type III pantothenate kinase
MNLTIDIGNTNTKIAIFENNNIILAGNYEKFAVEQFRDLKYNREISNIIISSVVISNSIISGLRSMPCNVVEFDYNTPLPVRNEYKTPKSLGNDRLAAVVGANSIFPGNNILVIDAGTAITYDIITYGAVYTGGNISPGLAMRFRALNKFTDRLPLLSQDENYPDFGSTTESAIISGVQKGIIYEMEGYINEAGRKYNNLKVILTGGDAKFFDKMLKKRIFVEPNLICIGLNTILEYNVKNR